MLRILSRSRSCIIHPWVNAITKWGFCDQISPTTSRLRTKFESEFWGISDLFYSSQETSGYHWSEKEIADINRNPVNRNPSFDGFQSQWWRTETIPNPWHIPDLTIYDICLWFFQQLLFISISNSTEKLKIAVSPRDQKSDMICIQLIQDLHVVTLLEISERWVRCVKKKSFPTEHRNPSPQQAVTLKKEGLFSKFM